jgi:DNA-binding beta-propeller fold protein YncE
MRRGLEYMTAGIAIHQNGERAYAVTRNGRVRVLSIPGNSLLTDEFQLGIPPNSAIPLNQVLVWGKYLLVGVSTTSEASEGKADSVFVFDSTSFRLVDTYPLDLPSQQLALAPDGSKLYAASFSPHNCITTYSKGRKIASLQNAGRTMTRFVVANAP